MNVSIAGPAQEAELLEALRWISSAGCTTTLIVCDGISERIFRFSPKQVHVLRSGPRRSGTIGNVLVDEGLLPAEKLDDVLEACRATGRRFGEAAVDLELVSYADVATAIRIKIEEEMLDIFCWPGAEFRVLQGEPPASYKEGRYYAASHDCDVPVFIDEMLTRVNERRAVVGRLPTGREVYRLEALADLTHVPDGVRDLLDEFDGSRLAKDVIESSPMRRCPAWEVLLHSVREGFLKRVPTSEAQGIVDAAATREIETLEGILDRAVDSSVARMRLARACERTGQPARAAAHWRHAGDEYRIQGAFDRAASCYENCVRLAPTDFGAREKILDIHHKQRQFGRVVADGRPLADMLVKHNLLNRAKRLLLQLVAIEPKDAALRRQLIAVLMGLGEQGVALHHQRELAGLLEKRGASSDEVLEAYLGVLAVDGKDAKAKSCIDRLTGVSAQRRAVWGTAVTTLVLLAAFGGAFMHEADAREKLRGSISDIENHLEAERFEAARHAAEGIADATPYSVASLRARTIADRIAEIEATAKRRDGSQTLRDVRAREKRQRESRATAQAKRVLDLVGKGKIEGDDGAHAQAARVLEEFAGTDFVSGGGLRAPLNVAVLPDDAVISVDGEEVGPGSRLVMYDPSATTELTISRDGFGESRIVIDGLHAESSVSVSLAPPRAWSFKADGGIDAPPLIDEGMVYVPSRDRRITALDVATGEVRWRVPLGFYADIATSPIRVDAGVLVATGSGDVVCLDPETGATIWRRELGIAVDAQPIATRGADGVVVIGADDGRLIGLAQRDGETRWDLGPRTIARDTSPRTIDGATFAYVAESRGIAVAGFGDGRARVRPNRDLGLMTTPSIELGRIWVAARDGTLRTISAQDGRPVESFVVPGGVPFAPCLFGEVAFAPSTKGALLAYRADGETLFQATLPEPAGATPAQGAGVVYVPGAERQLMAVDSGSGALLWKLDCGAPLRATPVLGENILLVATVSGELIALRSDN